MVEQLPHCDLLRLSLSTGRFVLSARQVFLGRLRMAFFKLLYKLCRVPMDYPKIFKNLKFFANFAKSKACENSLSSGQTLLSL